MKNLLLLITILFATATSCSVTKPGQASFSWTDIAVIEELEVYTDTSKITYKDGYSHAWIKTVYMTEGGRNSYKNNIRDRFRENLGLSEEKTNERMNKWDGFSYNISHRVYDCMNKRYKILEITDYTGSGNPIVTTKTPKDKENWVDVGMDTMGDYTLFSICDYGN